ncbi:tyrosine-type recombinase/integrase [Rhizobium sp. TH2]|uniref:tyrosine-type recombinase/integrase n=1 Tax=Rhizobium sp. TH2 TaxID=2775403 RepID=UPI00215867BA|nr:tyrosine-type recombinase/integrase [Rhizobium sp. TH2]UVC09592.1 tyrosine-type recombinase/integrase [Rhizobium sp. TH2]
MKKHCPKNERIKRDYFIYLKEAKRMDISTIDAVAAAIAGFEQWTRYRDFQLFRIAQATGFKTHLANERNKQTGKPLAKSTIHARLIALKHFFSWLAGQQGYRSRIAYSDAEYFNPNANDSRIATAHRDKRVPTIDQTKLVLSEMPTGSDVEKRDRAIIAFTLLTGARDDATASLKMRHLRLPERRVFQDARDVRTKNRKSIDTTFFPVGDDVEAIVTAWIDYLTATLLFGPDDPVFPKTRMARGNEGYFGAAGLCRDHWSNAAAIRRIFKTAFEAAGLPYANPHSLRSTLAALGQKLCRSPEDYKAWSQNLGHEQVLTTFVSYGNVAADRQAEIINGLKELPSDGMSDGSTIEQIAALVESLRMKA